MLKEKKGTVGLKNGEGVIPLGLVRVCAWVRVRVLVWAGLMKKCYVSVVPVGSFMIACATALAQESAMPQSNG